MKKLLTALLCTLLAMALCSAAMAETTPTFSSTRTFVNYLDSRGVIYTLYGLDSDGDELVIVPNSDSENDIEYDVYMFFDQNNENCYIYIWDLMSFSDANYLRVLQTVNALNDSYRYVTFTVDEDDNTVFLTLDLIYRSHDVDAIVWEALMHAANIINNAYPTLAPYAQ